MSDTIEITTAATLKAWCVPNYAYLVRSDIDESDHDDDRLALSIETAPREVVDALAKQWLNQLYASRGEVSPFTYLSAPPPNQ